MWYTDSLIKIYSDMIFKYNIDILNSSSKLYAMTSDLLFKYPVEQKILKMLINQGLGFYWYELATSETKLEKNIVIKNLQKYLHDLAISEDTVNEIIKLSKGMFLIIEDKSTVDNFEETDLIVDTNFQIDRYLLLNHIAFLRLEDINLENGMMIFGFTASFRNNNVVLGIKIIFENLKFNINGSEHYINGKFAHPLELDDKTYVKKFYFDPFEKCSFKLRAINYIEFTIRMEDIDGITIEENRVRVDIDNWDTYAMRFIDRI